jgi:hypothetical protein
MYDINDTPGRSIRAFPTIKLFPAASKTSPEIFLGPRTLDDLAEFIKDKGSFHAGFQGLGEHNAGTVEQLPDQHMRDTSKSACATEPDRKTQSVDHSELWRCTIRCVHFDDTDWMEKSRWFFLERELDCEWVWFEIAVV